VTGVCEAQLPATEASFTDKAESTAAVEDERSTRFQERFIALAKRYWGSLPSSSTGETVTDSYTGLEAAEDLVDVIWTLDQAFENKTAASGNAEATKKASNRLATLVKGLNVSTFYRNGGSYPIQSVFEHALRLVLYLFPRRHRISVQMNRPAVLYPRIYSNSA
jgi:hypothetical protein